MESLRGLIDPYIKYYWPRYNENIELQSTNSFTLLSACAAYRAG